MMTSLKKSGFLEYDHAIIKILLMQAKLKHIIVQAVYILLFEKAQKPSPAPASKSHADFLCGRYFSGNAR